ncbi:hypothetical protein [Dokdonella sp.]|uniref:hypothetical protein n=1 Tax=Dokdonella sp. TaxID=2291710 RepID=UPI003783EAF7
MKHLVVVLAAIAQAGAIAWGADFLYASHSQAAALFRVPGVITWMLALLVLGMGWGPLLAAAILAELVALSARWLPDRETPAPGYLFCALAIALLGFAGWQWGLAHWPPLPPGPNDSRGTLFRVMLTMTALIYLPTVAFAVRMALGPRPAGQ